MAYLQYWQIDQQPSDQELEICLPDGWYFELIDESERNLEVLDSADWRIWKKDQLLIRERNQLTLYSNGEILATARYRARDRFWWQLAASPLGAALKELLGLRAFVKQHHLRLHETHFNLLNEDTKIIARISLIRSAGSERSYLGLETLRGYEKESAVYLQGLNHLPLSPLTDLTLRHLASATGIDQLIGNKLKLPYQLTATDPAEIAVCGLAENMLTVAVTQERGIIDDIDTEFLHHYRVQLRKARSLISLCKNALSKERSRRLKDELKIHAVRTNRLRDLDVFLLDKDHYLQLLPKELHHGFRQLFQKIRKRRTRAWKSVADSLLSEDYRVQIKELFKQLRQPPELSAKESGSDILSLASRKIDRQYRKILKDGACISDDTPDEEVHELRIECKKLRYLLEFFSELFPDKELKQLVKQLKKLQDNLGRFNDYSVQQEFLLELARDRQLPGEQLASINGLVAALFNMQRIERTRVVANIQEFSAPAVQEKFTALFTNPEQDQMS